MITLEECKDIHFSGAREYLRLAEKYLNDMLTSVDSPNKETARLHCAVLHNLRMIGSVVDGLEKLWGITEEEWESEELWLNGGNSL